MDFQFIEDLVFEDPESPEPEPQPEPLPDEPPEQVNTLLTTIPFGLPQPKGTKIDF